VIDKQIINFEEIKKILPHRYPFLLIDRVLSVSNGDVKALKNVCGNEPFFNGHFPQFAVMPGVLQIEAMAQAGGLILAASSEFDVTKEVAFLAAVDEAKFKKVVVPGDQLIIEAKVVAKKKGLLKISAHTTVDGNIASQANIILIIKPL
jgi:3-hydroxyacyl-[acyl-carrier-protein] dehydratase